VLAVVDDDERFLISEKVFSDLDEVVLAPLRLGEPFLARCEGYFETDAACTDIAAAERGTSHAVEVARLWIR